MTARAHPSAELHAAYATGELPLAAALTVAVHCDTCRECREAVAGIEAREGRELIESAPAAMAPDALQRALARLDAVTPQLPPPQPRRLADIEVPAPVAALGLRPRRWMGPGLWSAQVRTDGAEGWRCHLVRVPGGQKLPRHRHPGDELICILQGAFDDGKRHSAGDFVRNPAGSEHGLVVSPDGPCACLIATEAPLQWLGRGWIVGPVLGL